MTLPQPPSSYYMCSEAECQERQSSGEISIFEAQWPPRSPTTYYAAPRGTQQQSRRMVDPLFAMKKFRRSAAGVDTKNRTPPRSLEQLECCLDTLEYILSHQQQPPKSASNDKPFPKQPLTGTVSFVEDRIRAIQVDLVVSQTPSAALQYRIAKCHILILYLLDNVQTYEAKFGQQALSAALTNYWDEHDQQGESPETDDEILCFMALQQLCQYYRGGEEESSLSLILGYYRRNVVKQPKLDNYPKFQWALQLVQLAIRGQPRSILRQLAEMGRQPGGAGSGFNVEASASFAILCRCCLAPIVDELRIQTLEQCNKSYMKGEKVKSEEIARLLYINSSEQAGDFCQTMAGLTRTREDGDKIVFKVGPVQRSSDQLGTSRQDEFVFGTHWNGGRDSGKEPLSAWDDPEPATLTDEAMAYGNASTDAEGVRIPPSALLHRILLDMEL